VSARDTRPYWLVRKFDAEVEFAPDARWLFTPAYWLVDFRAGNHVNVLNGQRWHSRRAALHAIALVDPGGQHRVVER
jgi:uncharacterized protein YegP (UPF0339 family)